MDVIYIKNPYINRYETTWSKMHRHSKIATRYEYMPSQDPDFHYAYIRPVSGHELQKKRSSIANTVMYITGYGYIVTPDIFQAKTLTTLYPVMTDEGISTRVIRRQHGRKKLTQSRRIQHDDENLNEPIIQPNFEQPAEIFFEPLPGHTRSGTHTLQREPSSGTTGTDSDHFDVNPPLPRGASFDAHTVVYSVASTLESSPVSTSEMTPTRRCLSPARRLIAKI